MPRPMYAKLLLVYPANGRGLPTLKCCSMNCGSGKVDTCVGACLAACQPCRAASICGLFFSASSNNSARGETAPECCGSASCARVLPPKAHSHSRTQRVPMNLVVGRPVKVFLTSKDIFFLLNVRIEPAVHASACRICTQSKTTGNGTVEWKQRTHGCRRRTVQKRIRSARKNEACRVLEGNAAEP